MCVARSRSCRTAVRRQDMMIGSANGLLDLPRSDCEKLLQVLEVTHVIYCGSGIPEVPLPAGVKVPPLPSDSDVAFALVRSCNSTPPQCH